ncbi:MAG: dienelactone hydrolase family protein [Vicinamibacterales bacterium]
MHPHNDQPLATAGAPLGTAPVVIMVHGRGAGPANILDLVPRLALPGLTYLAPSAAGKSWYPFSFMSEREKNEPGLSSALDVLAGLVERSIAAGVPAERIALLGFSQGACLTAEFTMRHARRYGGVVVFSGGLIGPPGTTWNDVASEVAAFDGTPVFLGCSDVDSHVPKTRVDESAEVFSRMGAVVTKRIYPSMGHLVNDDEIGAAQDILSRVAI